MRGFFPTQTGVWKLEEPPAFRRLSMSIVEMAVITGVLLRLYRAVVRTQGPADSMLYFAATFAFGMILLFGMETLHLGNFTLKHWTWRAPAFGALEALAESLTALLLILIGREPLGDARAMVSDWPAILIDTFFWRLLSVILFALLLAGVVQFVRYVLLRREDRGRTLDAVQREEVGNRE